MQGRADLYAASGFDVSRETIERLQAYAIALKKWSPTINLVARAGLEDIWSRHILDSAQIWRHVPSETDVACDIGSGGGLPGIVLACLGAEVSPSLKFILMESDARKAAFLKLVSDELGLRTTIIRARVEEAEPADARVLTARALAPLPLLLKYCHRHLSAEGVALLPKGRTHQQEVEAARLSWHFDWQAKASYSDPESATLVVRNLHPLEKSR